MRAILVLIFGILILTPLASMSLAASEQAIKLRAANDLAEFGPPESFLNGNFIADEVEPAYIFGKVKDFVKSRSCPAAWLIEAGENKRLQARAQQSGPFEYTLYLEEDCPGRTSYYVFVDRSASAVQWLEWRKQFHKSKAEPQYGAAKQGLDQASLNGYPVDAELRFVQVGSDLQLAKPEDILTGELKFQPIYDLRQGKAIGR